MRLKKLSARLSAMASFVSTGESVADIGADHGYLSLFLVREGISPSAILTDVQEGPLEKTRISVEKATSITEGLDERISLRLGDGLVPLEIAEVDVVAIAGMGGETIISILSADPDKTGSFRRYILQPRTKVKLLKDWLLENHWAIIAETSAKERDKMCDIIVCTPEGESW